MVGGGQGAFIGAVHRMAATLDGLVELVCGALSSDPERSRASGAELHIAEERSYGSWEEMLDGEARIPLGERMDFVTIVTPNHLHYPVASRALEQGFAVVCDKPMTFDLDQARRLARQVEESGALFALTHNYTGYPMIKEARARIRRGELGTLRKVVVEYPQGWLASPLEESDQKQASWRTDPERAGASCCMGDIGTHAENLTEYVTGLEIEALCADLSTFVPGRKLDDDGNVLLRFRGGARGVLHASQISIDEENALSLRVYGQKGGLEWRQEEPNTLIVKHADRPREIVRTGANYGHLSPEASFATRLPAGHPEGFVEAFANLYRNFALCLGARLEGGEPPPEARDFPTVDDGVRGMLFIDTVVRSSRASEKWTSMA
jgi:predicted dehydrogenase